MKAKHDALLKRADQMAWWLDEAFRLPGTNFRFGWDAILGLCPGVGDALAAIFSIYIILEGLRLGMPNSVLARMVWNVGVETLVGSVPLAGDAFDAVWKSNRKNANLLHNYLERPERVARHSKLWIALGLLVLLLALALFVALSVALGIAVVNWLRR